MMISSSSSDSAVAKVRLAVLVVTFTIGVTTLEQTRSNPAVVSCGVARFASSRAWART